MADGGLPIDEVIRFEVPGVITPWARAGGHGHVRFTPAPQRSFMATIKQMAADAMDGRRLLDGPCEVKILAVYLWPKSLSAKRRLMPGAAYKTSVPDVDNIWKIVGDAIKLVVFTDDARVSDLHVFKRLGDHPGLTVEVRPL